MSVLRPDIPDSIDSGFAGLVDAVKSGWYLNDLNEYFRGFPVSADDVMLDVGCGAGAATIFCAQRGAKVIYSDVVSAVVEELTEKLKSLDGIGECLPLVSDSDPLLVEDETATRIVCSEVLEHVDDPARVMEELVRVGKPGALYLLTVPGEKGEKIQQSFAPSAHFEKPNHIRIFSRSDFEALVEKAGLSIQSYSATGFYRVMWMSIYWAVEAASGGAVDASATHKEIAPPFDDSLDRWSALWVKLISTPEGLAFKHQMDELLPKNQVVVAKKGI